jgi:hypothetical protein
VDGEHSEWCAFRVPVWPQRIRSRELPTEEEGRYATSTPLRRTPPWPATLIQRLRGNAQPGVGGMSAGKLANCRRARTPQRRLHSDGCRQACGVDRGSLCLLVCPAVRWSVRHWWTRFPPSLHDDGPCYTLARSRHARTVTSSTSPACRHAESSGSGTAPWGRQAGRSPCEVRCAR